jgi:hypothetical protein
VGESAEEGGGKCLCQGDGEEWSVWGRGATNLHSRFTRSLANERISARDRRHKDVFTKRSRPLELVAVYPHLKQALPQEEGAIVKRVGRAWQDGLEHTRIVRRGLLDAVEGRLYRFKYGGNPDEWY